MGCGMRMVIPMFLVLTRFVFAGAVENQNQKMKSDQSQVQYQRKSITFLGTYADRMISISSEELMLIEGVIRKKIELRRFDYNHVELGANDSVERFVEELRRYIKQQAIDRASAEAEYEARFKRFKITAADIERIMSSAYLYRIRISHLKARRSTCPENRLEALSLGCTPDAKGILVALDAQVVFYRVNLMDDTRPPYELLREVRHVPVEAFSELPDEIPPEQRADAKRYARSQALSSAAAVLAEFLSKGMKQIPDFKLLSPVTAVLGDGVEFMLGRSQGVSLDDTYDVVEYDAGGNQSLLGHVKVRTIGTAQGTGEGTPSYAENVKVKSRFVGGEQLFEHPMIGLSLGVNAVMEFVVQDVLTSSDVEKKSAVYPGVGFVADLNIARFVGVSELYLSVEGDLLVLPNENDIETYLAHGMFGVKKKWYLESLVIALGARFGASYYIVEDYEDDVLGLGGDVWVGMEYYLVPEFSIYVRAAGRYFTNPLSYDFGEAADPETGLCASAGVFVAF